MALKVGAYRHAATGFVCVEVNSMDELLACNGILIAHGTWWQWFAGRDFRDFMGEVIAEGSTTLPQLAGKIYDMAFGSLTIGTAGDVNYERPHVTRVGTAAKDAANVRIWGLPNNLDSGFGQSSKVSTVTPGNIMIGHANGNSTFSWANATTFPSASAAGYLGACAVRTNLNKTYSQLIDGFASGVPDGGKSEVQEKLLAAKTRVLALLATRGVAPTDMVPLIMPMIITSAGEMRYVPPKRDQMLTAVVGSENLSNANYGNYTNGYKGVRSLGCRAYGANGRGVAVPPSIIIASKRGSYHQPDSLASTGGNYDAFTAMGATYIADTCPRIDFIDGVRVERIQLGLAGNRLLDTGEQNPVGDINLSTASVWTDYWSKVNVETGALPAKTGSGAAQETDAAFEARITGIAVATPRVTNKEITLTNFDSWGMTAGNVLALWSMALNEAKAKKLEGWPFLPGASVPTGVPTLVATTRSDVLEGSTVAARSGTVYDESLFAS